MEKIRIGNDFTVEWSIIRKLNGESSEYNLEGRNLVLKCVSPYTTIEVKNFSVEGNVIKWPFYGKDQKVTGIYSLILEENKGEYGMVTIDVISAFMLVPHTKDEQRSSNSALAIEKIELTSEVIIGVGASVTVDSELSESSENPVQNMVVTSALNALGEALDTINENLGKKADAEVVGSLTEGINSLDERKVDKIAGKGLSTEDFTTAEKSKLAALRNFDSSGILADIESLQNNKVDKEEGKGLSTNDFTTLLKEKLESLNNYDDTDISNAVARLRDDFDSLTQEDASEAIENFNEIISFLSEIEDSESLDGIIASIEQQIAAKQDKLISGQNIKTINGQSVLGSGDIQIGGNEIVSVTSSETNVAITPGKTYFIKSSSSSALNINLSASAPEGTLTRIILYSGAHSSVNFNNATIVWAGNTYQIQKHQWYEITFIVASDYSIPKLLGNLTEYYEV